MSMLLNKNRNKNNTKNHKNNYTVKILNTVEEVNSIFKENKYILKSYKYELEIYMVSKNENFSKIKKLEDIKDYAVIKDDNGDRKVIFKNNKFDSAKIHSIYLIHNLLYTLGYYELCYINKDIYNYEIQFKEENLTFNLIEVKDQGCFLEFIDISLKNLKEFLLILKRFGIKIEEKNLKIDILSENISKALFKRK